MINGSDHETSTVISAVVPGYAIVIENRFVKAWKGLVRVCQDNNLGHIGQVLEHRGNPIQEGRLYDQVGALGLVDHIGKNAPSMCDVDGHLDGSELAEPKPQEKELRPVPHNDADFVSLADSERLKSCGDLIGGLVEIAVPEDLVTKRKEIAVTTFFHFCLEGSVDDPFRQNVRAGHCSHPFQGGILIWKRAGLSDYAGVGSGYEP